MCGINTFVLHVLLWGKVFLSYRLEQNFTKWVGLSVSPSTHIHNDFVNKNVQIDVFNNETSVSTAQ